MRARLVARYAATRPPIRAAGRAWYADEGRSLAALAADAGPGVGPVTACAVAAILAPRVQWEVAKRAAAHVLRTNRAPGLVLTNREALALRCLRTRDPAGCIGRASAPKTWAFWRNLSGDAEPVTVDVWASRAAGVEPPRTFSQYRRIADAYTAAALDAGETPRDFQAILWIHERGRA